MRYLVFGDVHGNLDALEAVLAEGERRGAEGYLFLGDVVGYGPCPLQCIGLLARLQARGRLAWVLGNHERVVLGQIEPSEYSAEAMETLQWTRALLAGDRAASKFLATGHLSAQVNDTIWLTHDSLVAPGTATYHRWPQNAKSELACLRWHGGRVCFYGHTHSLRAELTAEHADVVLVPMEPHAEQGRDPKPLRLGPDTLGWIGAGSVGLPTNPQRRAEFLILDDTDPDVWTVEKYSVEYPRERARQRVRDTLGAVCSAAVLERIGRWL
jgi:predicted phosphodiesterase